MADDELLNFLEQQFKDSGEPIMVPYESLPVAKHLNVGLASVINKGSDEEYLIFDFDVQNQDEPVRVLLKVTGGIARSILTGELAQNISEGLAESS